jgi:hypothetical protein
MYKSRLDMMIGVELMDTIIVDRDEENTRQVKLENGLVYRCVGGELSLGKEMKMPLLIPEVSMLDSTLFCLLGGGVSWVVPNKS